MVVPDNTTFDIGITLNFNLLVMTGGKERTRTEFNDLLRSAGFEVTNIFRKASAISLIIAKKIS